jgi:energy-coupling factor transporter ATP-binding protein EcfA2
MVFQSYALYPHMSVQQEHRLPDAHGQDGPGRAGAPDRDAAKVLNLTDYLDRRPGQLSGGQRQRVAIGRAIVREPAAFLFDEPLSNLDAALRVGMRLEISELHKRLDTTMIYVTHDQVEAMTMADKIVVLRAGNIEQVGSPLELYRAPRNTFVAGFIGSPKMNLIDGAVAAEHDATTIGIRPEHVRVSDETGDWQGTVGCRSIWAPTRSSTSRLRGHPRPRDGARGRRGRPCYGDRSSSAPIPSTCTGSMRRGCGSDETARRQIRPHHGRRARDRARLRRGLRARGRARGHRGYRHRPGAWTAAEIGDAAIAVELDVTRQDSIDAAVAETVAALGRIDILINNAAIFTAAPMVEIERADYQRVFDINVAGTLFTLQAVARHMIDAASGAGSSTWQARRGAGASRWSRSTAPRRRR